MQPLFDLHCDTLSKAFKNKLSLRSSPLHITFEQSSIFSPYHQIMAIWTDDELSDSEGFSQYLKIIEFAKSQGLNFATKFEDKNNYSLFLSIEDARIIENDISRIELLYNNGVRFVTPVWKGSNVLGGAWNTCLGLSNFGKLAISKMLYLGIIIDVSHASKYTFDDILELCSNYDKTPIATHSNSYSICAHKRNLTDEQFSKLVSLNSIVGISLASEHLSSTNESSIDDILRHIEHYLFLDGENNICLGCDFDGISTLPTGFKGISSLPFLYNRLINEYGEILANKIFYTNACDFMKRNLIA